MSRHFPGPHHCIATARTVSDSLYGYIKSRCLAGGGNLTLADLEDANAAYLDEMATKFEWFESLNKDCMKASACVAPPIFGREVILASVLAATCGGEFDAAFGGRRMADKAGWRRLFFTVLAQYVREHADGEADGKLIGAYAEAVRRFGAKMSLDDLAVQRNVQRILQRLVAGLRLAGDDALTAAAAGFSDVFNSAAPVARAVGPDDRPGAVTQREAVTFLAALRQKWDRA